MLWNGQGEIPVDMIPDGYILADGRKVDKAAYPDLARVYTYLPDLSCCIVPYKTDGSPDYNATRVWVVQINA